MPAATLTTKGQITIPVAVREDLGVNAGDRLDFVRNELTGRYEIIPAKVPVVSLFGLLPRPKKAVSVEAMNEAVRRRAAELSQDSI